MNPNDNVFDTLQELNRGRSMHLIKIVEGIATVEFFILEGDELIDKVEEIEVGRLAIVSENNKQE